MNDTGAREDGELESLKKTSDHSLAENTQIHHCRAFAISNLSVLNRVQSLKGVRKIEVPQVLKVA